MQVEVLDSVARLIDVCTKREDYYQKSSWVTNDIFLKRWFLETISKNQRFIEKIKKVCDEEGYLLPPVYEDNNPVNFSFIPIHCNLRAPAEALQFIKKIEEATIRVLQETFQDLPPILISLLIYDYIKDLIKGFTWISNLSLSEHSLQKARK